MITRTKTCNYCKLQEIKNQNPGKDVVAREETWEEWMASTDGIGKRWAVVIVDGVLQDVSFSKLEDSCSC